MHYFSLTCYLVNRGEMFDYIVANRHVPERQACMLFHQLLNGVEELHDNEITHRDLKPENLLLKQSPRGLLVKIVDFGLSNTHDVRRPSPHSIHPFMHLISPKSL